MVKIKVPLTPYFVPVKKQIIVPKSKLNYNIYKELVLKPIKWQDLLEEGKNGHNAFQTGAKIHFSKKNILGLGAL